jgi:hypothetical protein
VKADLGHTETGRRNRTATLSRNGAPRQNATLRRNEVRETGPFVAWPISQLMMVLSDGQASIGKGSLLISWRRFAPDGWDHAHWACSGQQQDTGCEP